MEFRKRNPSVKKWNLFIYDHGVGICSWLWDVPLSDSGYAGTFQDQMHILSTVIVVLLSIISLILIIVAGINNRSCRFYGIFAGIALGMMMIGAFGMNIVPKEYFGIVERFSAFCSNRFSGSFGNAPILDGRNN